MKNFIKIIFGSCLGVILAFCAVAIIGGGIIGAVASTADKGKKVKENSVLYLTLEDNIPEQTGNSEIDFSTFNTEKKIGLTDMVKAIEAAQNDDKIKGIYLDISSVQARSATATTLREAVLDFKNSGKFVVAYSKYFTQGAYYLASAADKIYLNPMGAVDFRGYGATLTFFAEMLDEIGVDVEVFKVGKFKGAVEPYVKNELSEENRLQIRQYVNGLWTDMKADVAEARGKTISEIEMIAENFSGASAEGALSSGLVDVIGYEDEAHGEMKNRLGIEADDKINLISLSDYFPNVKENVNYEIKDKIAVIYAEGGIVDGEGEAAEIGDKKYVKIIRKLRKNDKVKAIVLRVNSGGGSAMASENIWRELDLCRSEGKPVVTSMGDVAASGGYYIACASDSIFAEPNSITGSIGVFGLFPIMTELFDENLHINFDTVKTAQYSTSFNTNYNMTESEKAIMQNNTNRVYQKFMTRVMNARSYKSLEEVNEIAQGRVWTGRKALEIGLIDRFGGLEEAIASAATLAGLDSYRITNYPKQKEPLQKLMEDLTGQKVAVSEQIAKNELGEYYKYYSQIKKLKHMKGVQAVMPFNIEVK